MPGAKEMLSKMFDPAFESILKMMEVSTIHSFVNILYRTAVINFSLSRYLKIQ